MLTEPIRAFRKKLREGFVLGPFCKSSDPAFLEAAGYAGFDFVIIDLERGPNTIQAAQNMVRAACIGGALPIVRVKEDAPSVIGEALDIGAGGIQVPQVRTAVEARRVLERARFAPQGRRGDCRFVRAADYSAMDRHGFCRKKGMAVGTFTDTLEDARKWREAGIRYLSYSVDAGLFLDACRRVVQSVRSPAAVRGTLGPRAGRENRYCTHFLQMHPLEI